MKQAILFFSCIVQFALSAQHIAVAPAVLSAYQIGKDREIIMPLIVNEATTKE